jgi:hypothetical protein
MAINFASPLGGTFDSQFNLFVDVRFGGLGGPIVLSPMLQLVGTDIPWDRTPPANALLIFGVNDQLCGAGNTLCDFWPGTVTEAHPGVGVHVAEPADTVPEPGMAVFLGVGGLAVLSVSRRLARRENAGRGES